MDLLFRRGRVLTMFDTGNLRSLGKASADDADANKTSHDLQIIKLVFH
jgi:hypothetical protein